MNSKIEWTESVVIKHMNKEIYGLKSELKFTQEKLIWSEENIKGLLDQDIALKNMISS